MIGNRSEWSGKLRNGKSWWSIWCSERQSNRRRCCTVNEEVRGAMDCWEKISAAKQETQLRSAWAPGDTIRFWKNSALTKRNKVFRISILNIYTLNVCKMDKWIFEGVFTFHFCKLKTLTIVSFAVCLFSFSCYKGCSKSNTPYVMMLSHNVRGKS